MVKQLKIIKKRVDYVGMPIEDFSSKLINDAKVVRICWSLPRGFFIIEPVLKSLIEILEIKVTYFTYHDNQESIVHFKSLEDGVLSKPIRHEFYKLNVPIDDQDYINDIEQFVKGSLLKDYLYFAVSARCLAKQNTSVTLFCENELIYHPGIPEDFPKQAAQQDGMRGILVTLKDLYRYVYGLSPRTLREDEIHEKIPQIKENVNTYLLEKSTKATNPYEIKEILSRYRKTFTLIEV